MAGGEQGWASAVRLPGRAERSSVAEVPRGVANTNIVHHAGKLMALQEQSEPFELDPKGFERGDFMNTGGKFTAHPKMDPETGEMIWFGYFRWSAAVQKPDRLWHH